MVVSFSFLPEVNLLLMLPLTYTSNHIMKNSFNGANPTVTNMSLLLGASISNMAVSMKATRLIIINMTWKP